MFLALIRGERYGEAGLSCASKSETSASPAITPSMMPPNAIEPTLRTDSSAVRGCPGTATNSIRSAGHIHATVETIIHRLAFDERGRKHLVCIHPASNPPIIARTVRTDQLRSIRNRSANKNGVVIPIVDAHIHQLVAPNHFRAINHWASPTVKLIPAPTYTALPMWIASCKLASRMTAITPKTQPRELATTHRKKRDFAFGVAPMRETVMPQRVSNKCFRH